MSFKLQTYLNIGTLTTFFSDGAKIITTRSISQYLRYTSGNVTTPYVLFQPLTSFAYGSGGKSDPFWKYSLIPEKFPDFGKSKYYGTQVLWNKWLLGKYTF